jgi:flavin-binding protein dodecin
MSDHVYSVSEIVGSSPDSIEQAIENAVARARKTIRNLDWFTVKEVRGALDGDGGIAYYQVTIKLGFRMEE